MRKHYYYLHWDVTNSDPEIYTGIYINYLEKPSFENKSLKVVK